MVVRNLAVGRADAPALEIDRRDLALQELESGRRRRVAQRVGHGMRRKLAGAHLIEQGREKVIVLPIDQRDRGFPAMQASLEAPDEVQTREPAAEHHDLLGRAQFAFPDSASTRSSSAR